MRRHACRNARRRRTLVDLTYPEERNLIVLKKYIDWLRGTVHVFPDAAGAWLWACENLKNEFLVEAVIPGIVIGPETGTAGGGNCFRLRLSSRQGGRDFVACLLPGAAGAPEPGDLVSFRIVRIADDLPEEIGVIGYIEARLAPVYAARRGWKVLHSYVPKNLKPQIRF